jgi:membrane-associated phospholipid phosphatase
MTSDSPHIAATMDLSSAGHHVARRRGSPFIAWPGWRHFAESTALALANLVWFEIVFNACDAITRGRTLRVPIATSLDLAIPFVQSMTLVYLSMDLLLLAGPLILRTRREFRAAIAMLASAIGIGGVCFLLIPAELAYPPVLDSELGIWAGAYHVADTLNLTYNLVPSLHVALTVACVAAFARYRGRITKALLWAWALAIALSTLLTHQHHIVDAVSGWVLGLLCFRFVYRPLARKQAFELV